MSNIKNPKEIERKVKDEGFDDFYFTYQDKISEAPPEEATHWCATSLEGGYSHFSGKLPKKKEVTFKYIMERISKQRNKSSVNYRELFEQIPGVKNSDNVSLYPASYGMGVLVLFKNVECEEIKNMKQYLDENDIEYQNEFSKARWVYRFKISQKQENIARIKKLIK